MTNEELKKYLQWMNKEYGPRGYSAGKGPPDMYGRQTTTGEEGWSDMTRDQLRTNQFGPNLPSGLGLLNSRADAEQVLGHRLVDNMGPQLYQSPTDMMSIDGIPRGPQLGEISAMEQQLAFGGGHPDELSLAQAPQYHGYDQFTRRPRGLLDSGEGQFSQAFPGSVPSEGLKDQVGLIQPPTWARQSTGLLEGQNKGSGWMADDRMRNAQNREFRLGQMLMNLGEKSREDDGWGGPLTHY